MISTIDIIIIAIYLVLIFAVSTAKSMGQGLDSFLVNNRSTSLPLLVLTIVSTNVGAGFFMSVAAEGYTTGISFGIVIACLSVGICMVLAYFTPKIKALADARSIYTLPEFLGQAYKSRAVLITSGVIILIGYFFVTALQFVGIAALGSVLSGLDYRSIVLISGVLTILYTSIGGIRSNVYADAISFIITAAIFLALIPVILGGAHVDLGSLPKRYFDPFAFGGPTFFVLSIAFSAIGAFFFMELWQRIFAAESVKTARRALIISAFVQVPFILTGLLFGLIGAVLFPNIEKSSVIFHVFASFLPHGLFGLGLVAVLAILMDTVNALVVVGGSILLNDFYRPFHPQDDNKRLLRLARVFTLLFGFASLATAIVLPDIVKLLLMGAFVMMPIGPATIAALVLRRVSARAAVASMIAGFVVTFAFLSSMPQTAFVPGFLTSLVIFIVFTIIDNRSHA